jgi:hypothetical protein
LGLRFFFYIVPSRKSFGIRDCPAGLYLRAKFDVVNLDQNTFDINTEFDRDKTVDQVHVIQSHRVDHYRVFQKS